MKLRRSRFVPLLLVAAIIGLVPLAAPAMAAPATVAANLDPVPDGTVSPGAVATFSLTITPDSRTLASYTLSPAAGYKIATIGTPTTGTASINSSGQIVVSGLSVSPSQAAVLTFTANASCVSGSQNWGLAARDSQGRTYSNGTSDLATEVAGACDLVFLNQPSNTRDGDLITDGDRLSNNPIRVQLVENGSAATPAPVTHFPVAVTFDLGNDPSGGTAVLTVGTETTNGNGIATFDDETPNAEGGDGLEIDTANVAVFTDFTLVPRGVTQASITGAASNGFDIWQDATACQGNCLLNHDGDTYRVPNSQSGSLLSASTFTTEDSNIDCAGYTEITGDVVWHEYTGSGPVLVTIHITRAEMKASANNGQARVEVCVGLMDEGTLTGQQKWANLGVTADPQDSNGDGTDDIWVALAPPCPNTNPSGSAPCIARQYGDGSGGSFTEVWIPGGDPPRRS